MNADFPTWYIETKKLSLKNKAYDIGKVTEHFRTFKQYHEHGLTPEMALKKYFL